MKRPESLYSFALTGACLACIVAPVRILGLTFTNDFNIGINDTNFDGQDIIVDNCVLTIDGQHAFNNLQLLKGAVLTHTAATNGYLPNVLHIANEPHTMSSSNPPALNQPVNVVSSSIIVTDLSGTNTYVLGRDYTIVGRNPPLEITLVLLAGSTILDGQNVLVSYDIQGSPVKSGLNLLVTNNVEIEAEGSIDAVGRGLAGLDGLGPGSTSSTNLPYLHPAGGGGGHGGFGGSSASLAPGGNAYGSVTTPTDKGCSGGRGLGPGGAGGGTIQMTIGGLLRVDGRIVADGADGPTPYSGGGSGGSIWLSMQTLSGAGSIVANGGGGEPFDGGGGGGGRVALYFETNNFSGRLEARGGSGAAYGGAGTIYLRNLATRQPAQVLADNAGAVGTNTLLSSTESVRLSIIGGAKVQTPGTLALAELFVYSNSSVTLAQSANPVPLVLSVSGDATISAGGSIDGDGKGFSGGQGPGHGMSGYAQGGVVYFGGGGGNGGYGGTAATGQTGGPAFGSAVTPIDDFGSGGGNGGVGEKLQNGGRGGGSMQLLVNGTLTVDGRVSADGLPGGTEAGGGSGGGVLLRVGTLKGSGIISVNGGDGDVAVAGGGGGGRLAIYYHTNQFTGLLSALGGQGNQFGGAGTIYTRFDESSIAQVTVDNGGRPGTNTLLSASGLLDLLITGGAIVDPMAGQQLHDLRITSNALLNFSRFSIPVELTIMHQATIEKGGGLVSIAPAFIAGEGPGFGYGGGGGHGGYGGVGVSTGGGLAYGSIASPNELGSRGASNLPVVTNDLAGFGGGALTITVAGQFTVDGNLSANGTDATGPGSGGGSGGSINLNAQVLSGSGEISVNGGAGGSFSGGGGGGGRMAVYYRTNQFVGILSAHGGNGKNPGGAGTIFLKSQDAASGRLLVNNASQPGTNAFINSSSTQWDLELTGATAAVGESANFHSMVIHSNSWLTSGTLSPLTLTLLADSTIEAGGGISVDGRGRTNASGPGTGQTQQSALGTAGGGGGYGGTGGSGSGAIGGQTYGSPTQPIDLGSSGGGYHPSPADGAGGGAIQLNMQQAGLILNGVISAKGNPSLYGGAGSGGSILLNVETLSGSGAISANGGDADLDLGGGGGGGRIAIYAASNRFNGGISAYGGEGVVYGGAGTIYSQIAHSTSRLIVDNGGAVGTNTPLPSLPGIALTLAGGAIASSGGMNLNGLIVESGAMLTQLSTQGSLAATVLGDVLVGTNASISVEAKGYNGLAGGPGVGVMTNGGSGSGAGYGGPGGDSLSGSPGGATYGSATAPDARGSRGGLFPVLPDFCEGGGALRLKVSGTLTVDGTLSANGNDAQVESAGGGSGGSVWVTARRLQGVGTISADGGAGDPLEGGGGGGGRIAIYAGFNSFEGSISSSGGAGAVDGGDGTILVTNLPPLRVIAQSPEGPIFHPVGEVDLSFSSQLDASSISSNTVTILTPNGPLEGASLSAVDGSTSLQTLIPPQNTPGYYEVKLDPNLQDIYGATMPSPYVGNFVILPPTISGHVTDTNGLPVAYVTVRANSGPLPVLTDTNGFYSIEVPPGWSGTITPSRDSSLFLPAFRPYIDVTQELGNQDFVMDSPIVALHTERTGTSLNLSWNGSSGATYQTFSSTNLVDWLPCDLSRTGTNGPMWTTLPLGNEPVKFFRVHINP